MNKEHTCRVHFAEFTFVGATTDRNGFAVDTGVVEFYARVRDTSGSVRGLAYDGEFNRFFATYAEAKLVCDKYEAGPGDSEQYWDHQVCEWVREAGE